MLLFVLIKFEFEMTSEAEAEHSAMFIIRVSLVNICKYNIYK